jgi:hypothetical protein
MQDAPERSVLEEQEHLAQAHRASVGEAAGHVARSLVVLRLERVRQEPRRASKFWVQAWVLALVLVRTALRA